MTPEEKIEALRKWAKPADDYRLDAYYQAQCEVRDIIDPPKPQWRQMVDALHSRGVTGTHLGAALYHLSHVANPNHYNIAEELANIVVVCEVAVGNGWRADPDDTCTLLIDADLNTPMWLLDSLVRYFEPANYRNTGNRAAYWLCGLTDGGDA